MKKAISYLVFAGTSEGRQLAEFFQKNQIPALFCVATAYGEELLEQTEEIIPAGWMKYRCRPVSWN